ncbi:unnamed protein product [Vitrella brassicaformis CCMP3155]|uniref:GAF domain-containing protein n=2 Tax=Vitrella brassicaformis TaxID=1169539 RepID=A0A0G4ERL3_VITBC|nr:unnamed protein product [Vitrella brassicaformis CCMP3155]|eukprot:CEM00101.1 unnamed protein product [Vitrella brassicaformis CCMP3155]
MKATCEDGAHLQPSPSDVSLDLDAALSNLRQVVARIQWEKGPLYRRLADYGLDSPPPSQLAKSGRKRRPSSAAAVIDSGSCGSFGNKGGPRGTSGRPDRCDLDAALNELLSTASRLQGSLRAEQRRAAKAEDKNRLLQEGIRKRDDLLKQALAENRLLREEKRQLQIGLDLANSSPRRHADSPPTEQDSTAHTAAPTSARSAVSIRSYFERGIRRDMVDHVDLFEKWKDPTTFVKDLLGLPAAEQARVVTSLQAQGARLRRMTHLAHRLKHELVAVHEMSQATTLSDALVRGSRSIQQVVQCLHGRIYLLDERRGDLWTHVETTRNEKREVEEQRHQVTDADVIGCVLSTSRCIRNATLTSDYTIRSYLDAPSEPFCSAPITDPRSRKVVGVIMATQKKSGATVGGWGWGGAHEGEQGFTSEDEELLRCFGLAAGVLVQKVEAIEKTTIQNQKMKDAVELALKLSSTKTFKELCTCLEKSLPHVVETPAVRLFCVDRFHIDRFFRFADGERVIFDEFRGLAGAVLYDGRQICVPQANADDRFDPGVDLDVPLGMSVLPIKLTDDPSAALKGCLQVAHPRGAVEHHTGRSAVDRDILSYLVRLLTAVIDMLWHSTKGNEPLSKMALETPAPAQRRKTAHFYRSATLGHPSSSPVVSPLRDSRRGSSSNKEDSDDSGSDKATSGPRPSELAFSLEISLPPPPEGQRPEPLPEGRDIRLSTGGDSCITPLTSPFCSPVPQLHSRGLDDLRLSAVDATCAADSQGDGDGTQPPPVHARGRRLSTPSPLDSYFPTPPTDRSESGAAGAPPPAEDLSELVVSRGSLSVSSSDPA